MIKFTKILCCTALLATAGVLQGQEASNESNYSSTSDFFSSIVAFFHGYVGSSAEEKCLSDTTTTQGFPPLTNEVIGKGPFSQKIDFFDSMGWNLTKNSVMKELYFFTNSHESHEAFNRINALKKLYDKNNFSQKDVQEKSLIPKIIHQIWIGPDKPPAILEESQKSIQKYHQNWEYKLWTDADITDLKLYNQKLYDLSDNYNEKADILRYEILHTYGGIYLNVNFICLKPFDALLHYDLCVSIQPLYCEAEIANSIIGSVPKNPILQECIHTIKDGWNAFHTLGMPNNTGSSHFQKSFMKFVTSKTLTIIAFPASFFYPIEDEDKLIEINSSCKENVQKIQSHVNPECFAVQCRAETG
ncbi:hypothetical protein H0X06_01650 [Candidatus Dependentiae bacterium]|nr:hypothetical protein [Candidatus Dependentiae bacterium]